MNARQLRSCNSRWLAGLLAGGAFSALLCGGCPSASSGNGEPGPAGPQGPAGPPGDIGATGAVGPAGPQGEAGATGATGAAGATGATGADGQLRIYGTGAAGALTISNSADWTADPPPTGIYQFTDLTIESGKALFVPSGTVIRCTGSFTNNGSLVVAAGSGGAVRQSSASGVIDGSFKAAGMGVAFRGPGNGEYGTNAQSRGGGLGADPPMIYALAFLVNPGIAGGSGGGAGSYSGGFGGGTLVVLAEQGIINNGTIAAEHFAATNGGGGGGGGIIILASKTQVTNGSNGVIDVRGGDGGPSTANSGAGGGGGGGLINLIAPAVFNPGTMQVDGGNAGNNSVAVTATPRSGGGGGGACVGTGGYGGDVSAGNASGVAESGDLGLLFITQEDPTPLF